MRNTENKKTIEWRFDIKFFIVFLIIFFLEVIIALFVNDSIIRPYGGDLLVVILIYYFVKSFIRTKTIYLVTGVILFAYLVEVSQYFHLVEILGMQDNVIMKTVMGHSFSWGDILAYTAGGIICYLIDRKQ